MDRDLLLQLFDVDPDNGILYWKNCSKNHLNGKSAGYKQNHQNGYVSYVIVPVNKQLKPVHRIIWTMVNGNIPDGMVIDHINRDGTDNRISNLRLASQSDNNCNSIIRSDNTTKVKGVSYNRKLGKYIAYIWKNKKNHFLGYFGSVDDAAEVVSLKRKEIHGDFANK